MGAKKMEEAAKLGVATLTEQQWREKLAAADSAADAKEQKSGRQEEAVPLRVTRPPGSGRRALTKKTKRRRGRSLRRLCSLGRS